MLIDTVGNDNGLVMIPLKTAGGGLTLLNAVEKDDVNLLKYRGKVNVRRFPRPRISGSLFPRPTISETNYFRDQRFPRSTISETNYFRDQLFPRPAISATTDNEP